jgi:hypothetical protein
MNFFEKELRGMFQHRTLLKDPVFCGKAMLAKLDDELRIRFEFVISNKIDEYTGIEAKIINRTGGMVDRNVFRFADIIGMKQTPLCGKREPYIWVEPDKTASWYTPVSDAEKQRIANAVMAYVELYQTPQQGPEMKM